MEAGAGKLRGLGDFGRDLSLDFHLIIPPLVDAGAEIREVFDEQPALEDVYLKLMAGKGTAQ